MEHEAVQNLSLQSYESIFDEKLDLLQLVNERTKLDWKGRLTQTISGKEVYPRPSSGQNCPCG